MSLTEPGLNSGIGVEWKYAARAAWLRSSHPVAFRNHLRDAAKDGGVTVSTGSIAAWEACRGVGTRNRSQKQSCQRQSGTCCL